MALNPTDAPIYDNRGGYTPGQVESTNGGYDPYAPQNYTGAYAPSFAGGYNGEQTLRGGGGYDPSSPSAYLTGTDSIGGKSAITDNVGYAPSFAGGYNGEQTSPSGGGYDPLTAANSFESEDARKSVLPENAAESAVQQEPTIGIQTANAASTGSDDDWRVRISLADKSDIFYKSSGPNPNNLMQPLVETNGVIFPYTPSISLTHAANYSAASPVHSNYSQQFYTNSEVSDFTITGEFTVQGIDEGKYLLAAIYFFRSATKMFFGSGANAGNPPPIVFLDGYGSHYFPHIPCVISSFTHTLPNDVDYIQIPVTTATLTESTVEADSANIGAVNNSLGDLKNATSGQIYAPQWGSKRATATTKKMEYKSVVTSTRVPAVSTITITLKPVYSRKNLHDNFNMNDFASGRLLQTATSGGFL
jgi:hypothetical protein